MLLVPAVSVGRLAGDLPRVLLQDGADDELGGGERVFVALLLPQLELDGEPGVLVCVDPDAAPPPEDVDRTVAGERGTDEGGLVALAHG